MFFLKPRMPIKNHNLMYSQFKCTVNLHLLRAHFYLCMSAVIFIASSLPKESLKIQDAAVATPTDCLSLQVLTWLPSLGSDSHRLTQERNFAFKATGCDRERWVYEGNIINEVTLWSIICTSVYCVIKQCAIITTCSVYMIMFIKIISGCWFFFLSLPLVDITS